MTDSSADPLVRDLDSTQSNVNDASRATDLPNTSSSSSGAQCWSALGYLANIAVHAVLVGFTIFVTFLSFSQGIQLFSWHPTCMLIGFFILMTEAILCFVEPNVPTLGLSFPMRRKIHWILQAIGACSITVAFTVVVLNKNRIGRPHFTTNHGIVGLTAVVCAGVALLGGVLALYSFELRNVLRMRPVYLKIAHSVFSVCGYILGIASIILGLYSPFFKETADTTTTIVCFVLIVLVATYTVAVPLWKSGRRIDHLRNQDTFTEDHQRTSQSTLHLTSEDEGEVSPSVADCTQGLAWFSISYNIIVHAVIISYTLYFIVISFYNETSYSIFNWHVPCMLIGYSICMAESMLTFSPSNLFTRRLARRSQVYVHWVLQVFAIIFITAGLFAAVIRKVERGKLHFQTYHAIFGIIAVAFSYTSMAGGLPAKYAFRLRRYVRPVYAKCGHSAMALITYAVAVVSIVCGLYSHWYARNSLHESMFYVSLVAILFGAQYVMYSPVANLTGRLWNFWTSSIR